MSYILLLATVFIMFFQPTAVFPALLPYQPLRNIAIISLLVYFIAKKNDSVPFFSIPENRYFFLFIIVQIISGAKLWLMGGYEILIDWLKIGIVYFLIIKVCVSERKSMWLAIAIIAGISYLSYYSITSYRASYLPGLRASGYGWYDQANDIAIIMVVSIPLCFLASELSRGIMSKIFLILVAEFGYNILITGSRNGLIGLAVVGLLCIVSYSKMGKFSKIILSAFMVIIISGIGIANVLLRSDLTGLTGDDSSMNRIVQWKACLRMVLANPLLGVGPQQAVDRATEFGGIRGLAPHNTIIQVFAECGIVGGLFFLLFSFYPLKSAYIFFIRGKSNISKVSHDIVVYKYLCISLVGFWICAFFSNRVSGYTLYVITAMLLASRSSIDKKDSTLIGSSV